MLPFPPPPSTSEQNDLVQFRKVADRRNIRRKIDLTFFKVPQPILGDTAQIQPDPGKAAHSVRAIAH